MKSTILHAVPIVVVGLTAIFHLTAQAQGSLETGLEDVVIGAFTIAPIVYHNIVKRKATKQA